LAAKFQAGKNQPAADLADARQTVIADFQIACRRFPNSAVCGLWCAAGFQPAVSPTSSRQVLEQTRNHWQIPKPCGLEIRDTRLPGGGQAADWKSAARAGARPQAPFSLTPRFSGVMGVRERNSTVLTVSGCAHD